ncbi:MULTISPECIES: iron ABC transporter permease [Prevotellaceae]|jgi:iron complex transport system permease protein|uniref:Iron ABC transporter n=1 Tax=Xylanibacter rarus TaxID=1676614 RepID=A0A8E1R325_9BACT|nr:MULTISPECIES: iron ABC transporter permease [Prevotellaceae]KOO69402.1 iron ABC transporter [Xylanibacter rarus]CCX68418.1 iron chelate uptake ABC transporter FeCT family permease protein [Prevotella sp. CAG:255]
MKKYCRFFVVITLAIIALFVINIIYGAVKIPINSIIDIFSGNDEVNESWKYIILQTRLPQALTAILCGGALAVSGLLLQTAFCNPLAGPSIFGINSGASLGVAFVMLLFGGSITAGAVSVTGFLAVLIAAFVGAVAVMAVLLFFSNLVNNNVMLLITGIMIGYISSSAISLLNFFATEEGVHSYMIWGLGNFGGVSMAQMPLFAAVTIVGLICALLLIKPLNAVLLGEQYAENLGINTIKLRNCLLLVTGLLTAVTTAYCGPIAFIGLAVPHIARMLLKTDNHRYLIPGTILSGAAISLLCNIICVLPGDNGIIPLNAVTPIMGAPVIIYVIIKGRHQ